MVNYWIWLASCKGITPWMRAKLLEHFSTPEHIYHGDREQFGQLGLSANGQEGLLDKNMDGVQAVLDACNREGIQIITYQDASYPQRLRELADPPCVLYVLGHMPLVDNHISIGVVGTRRATPYGLEMAMRTGEELAMAGVTTISGMALGVDSAALEGALRGGGSPIAVLGGGLDIVYPPSNKKLFQDLATHGAVVSEYPPGTPHMSHHFPIRNRIISGLSWGVVAVEAGARSGTGITAKLALDQDRDLFAYPGPANAPTSAGTNRLIKDGTAMMVLSPDDILGEYGIHNAPKPKATRRKKIIPTQERADLSEHGVLEKSPAPVVDKPVKKDYITLQEGKIRFTPTQLTLLQAMTDKNMSCDDLVDETSLPVREILSALTLLQVQGYLKEISGRRFASSLGIKEDGE